MPMYSGCNNTAVPATTYMSWRWDQSGRITIRRRRKTLLLPSELGHKTLLLPFELGHKLIELALYSRNIITP